MSSRWKCKIRKWKEGRETKMNRRMKEGRRIRKERTVGTRSEG